jgi:hypothetical protein
MTSLLPGGVEDFFLTVRNKGLLKENTMGRFLGFLLVILLGVAVLGFYRGWFSTETNRTDQKTNINLSVDREKIKDDVDSLKRKAGSVVENNK